MKMSTLSIPVALFAYARPEHLQLTLASLRDNRVPLIYAFSDGPRTPASVPLVEKVRAMLRSIDWCEVVLIERTENWGLGRSIMAGVTEVLGQHESCLVFEDDLVIVPGAYDYLVSALENYREDLRVMSVTGWTHPRITPSDVGDRPYFDGRAECWVWGTWRRAWQGINDKTAREMMLAAEAKGIDRSAYGSDLPGMAEQEIERNIWAVRFLYHHILNQGLCLRPPWSMVEHIGFDALATNANSAGGWNNPLLRPCPLRPKRWPDATENPACAHLRQSAFLPNHVPMRKVNFRHSVSSMAGRLKRAAMLDLGDTKTDFITARQFIGLFVPPIARSGYLTLRQWLNGLFRLAHLKTSSARLGLAGNFSSWAEAEANSSGYDSSDILEKTRAALLKVKLGQAVYERDSVLFDKVQHAWPLLAGLMWVAAQRGGRINVLDFGGSLGSSYFQNKIFLDALGEVRWHIVEQPSHVFVGQREFQDERLRFFDSIGASMADNPPDIILLSGVLQYIEQPYELLDILKSSGARFLIIDRTPFWSGFADRICVQQVPADIYEASYPSWIFSEFKLKTILSLNWEIISEFQNDDLLPGPVKFSYKGLIAVRVKQRITEKNG